MNKFKDSMSKEEINLLPLGEFSGKIHLITNSKDADDAVKVLKRSKILGFDTETRPAYKKGESYNVSMIQLANEQDVFIFRINLFQITDSMLDLLSSEKIIKAGVAIRDDIKGINKLRNFEQGGFVELAQLAKENKINSFGLRGLAAITLGVRISKSAKLTNWEKRNLNHIQLKYAATDAWVGREIYLKLTNS